MNASRSRKSPPKLRPEDMRIFVAIGCARTLTEAADQLKMPLFTVSRALKRIEATAQVVLIRRDGAGLHLTELGQAYLQACQLALQAHHTANDVLTSNRTEPDGVLQIASPVTFVQEVLSLLLLEFLQTFPKLRVELSIYANADQEPKAANDIFFKIGMPTESRHLMKIFPPIRQGLFATPQYLATHLAPSHPSELDDHVCLGLAPGGNYSRWNLSHGTERLAVQPNSRISIADPVTLSRLTLASAGITILPRWLVQDDLRRGLLIEVLPEWTLDPAVFCALYNGRLRPSSKEGAFLNFLGSVLGGPRDPRCKGGDPDDYFVNTQVPAKVAQKPADTFKMPGLPQTPSMSKASSTTRTYTA